MNSPGSCAESPDSATSAAGRTRLAPSPTGALHLGNARTFLVNWALARKYGWKIVLRIEDLDGPRIKPGAAQEAIEIFQWLGLDWDEGPFYQRHDLAPYQRALKQLARQGDLYSCDCTRTKIEQASLSAPHGGEHELRYPGTCRPAEARPLVVDRLSAAFAVRIRAPDEAIEFHDQLVGRQRHDVQCTVGDFLVRTKDGLPSYQLAVVVDDARQGITQVVRGDDLLSSTARQLWLYQRLGLNPQPQYLHLPLVVGPDGRRLAKRHGDSRLQHYRTRGVSAERILGLLAEWCGLGERHPLGVEEFLRSFSLDKVPAGQIVFRPEDDAWLLQTGL